MSKEERSEGAVSRSQFIKEEDMAEEKEAPRKLSRKDFVKGAAVGAAGVAAAGALASCAPAATPAPAETAAPCPTCPPAEECPPCPTPWLPERWDHEADVVVVGYGGAGASAALGASDAGAKVLILEKMPKGLEGGNTYASSAAMNDPYDKAMAVDYLYACCMGDTPNPCTSREFLRSFVDQIDGVFDWMESHGIEMGPESPDNPGLNKRTPVGTGRAVFQALSGLVDSKPIEVMYETPAKELIQDAGTKEILGVKATNASGEEVYIKAKKGVVMTLGGYEFNTELQGWFLLPGVRAYGTGSPGNEGDGIYMAQQVGACLWHMNTAASSGGLGILVPSRLLTPPIEWDLPIRASIGKHDSSYIVVNKYGKRFTNVGARLTSTKRHSLVGFSDYTYFSGETGDPPNEYPNLPCYLVFDEARRLFDTMVDFTHPDAEYGFAGHKGLYHWSDDCSKEIENGLITKADTFSELATKLGIDPAGLEETVAKYNGYCAAGEDPEFGRPVESLVPLTTPPFYGSELCLLYYCTCGGAKRNENAQVVDKDDKPIPRLYSAGEFGSFQGAVIPGRMPLAEALMVGELAGIDAAALESWE